MRALLASRSEAPVDPWDPLVFHYGSRILADEAYDVARHEATERSVQLAEQARLPAQLYGGIAGIGWALRHMQRDSDAEPWGADTDEPPQDDCAELDELLVRHLERPGVTPHFDLIVGLVGIGVYALEGLPSPSARRCLELVLDRLAQTAEDIDEGEIAWRRPGFAAAQRE
jgi:hypothetical protein